MSKGYDNFGRVTYVEPTNIIDGKGVRNEDFINHPYEDYCIAVDLQVRIPNRYSCGYAAQNGQMEILEYSSDNGTISFLRGSGENGDLTTRYTDVRISSTNDDNSTRECLGITSIDITYSSWMYPEVTIQFVDVMGASVMAPEEYETHRTFGDRSIQKGLYRSLFTFPYPMFILKVKGFYGQGVTYKLAIKNTTLNFDSATGNFNIKAEFIGYMYGIYTDIPMMLLSVAPYTEFGKKYWNKQVSEGRFIYHNYIEEESGPFDEASGSDITRDKIGAIGSSMLTFPEFRYKVACVANSQEYTSIATGTDSEVGNLEQEETDLSDISAKNPFKSVEGRKVYKLYDANNQNSDTHKYMVFSTNNDAVVKEDFINKFKDFAESINNYIDVHGTEDVIISNKIDTEHAKKRIDVTKVICTPVQSGNTFEWSMDAKNLTDGEKIYILAALKYNGYNTATVVSIIDMGECDSDYLDVDYNIAVLKSKLENRKKTLLDRRTARENAMIEKALGFRPSIKNLFDMAFAHMETFIQGMAEMLNNASNNDSKVRNFDSSLVDETDVSYEGEGQILPPFFKMFSKEDGKNTEIYFDKSSRFNGTNIEEDVYVKSLLEGARLYTERMGEIEKSIAQMTDLSSTTKTTIASDAPSVSCGKFIPLTVYDMVNKDTMVNPYSHIKKMCERNSDVRMATFAAVALRGFYFLCSNNGILKERIFKSNDARVLGKIEALNFYKAVGKKVNYRFIDFIEQFGNGKNEKSEASDEILNICSENSEGYRTLWGQGGQEFTKSLFKQKENGDLVYTLSNNEHAYFPIGETNFDSIVSDFNNASDITRYENYLPTKGYLTDKEKYKETQENWGILSAKTTFHIYEDRDYIKNLYENIQYELEEATDGEDTKVFSDSEVKQIMKIYCSYVRETVSGCTLYANEHPGLFESGDGGIISELKTDGNETKWADTAETKCEIDRVKDKDVKTLISDGSVDDWNAVYIKYPGLFDEDFDKPIFFEDVYTKQNTLEAKAYIFLYSMPIVDDDDDKGGLFSEDEEIKNGNGGISQEVRNGVVFKARLLREGASYWRENEKNRGKDPIDFTMTNKKQPEIRETPIGTDTTAQLVDDYNTIRFGNYYKEWTEPRGTTPSRKMSLMKYFKQWVLTDFLEIDRYGSDEKLYGSESGKGKKASKGLNGVYAYTTKRTDLTAQKAKALQALLRKLFLSPCITMDYYSGVLFDRDNQTYSNFNGCQYSELKDFLIGFMDGLKKLYKKFIDRYDKDKGGVIAEVAAEEAADPFKSYDLKLSLYQTLCNLYNKWICTASEDGIDKWKLGNEDSDFAQFQYVDTFYNDIGLKITANATKVAEWLSNCLPSTNLATSEGMMQYMERTLYQFLTDVSQDTGGILMALPQKLGLSSPDDIVKMFNTYNYMADGWNEDKTTFLFLYSYKPSEHLGDEEGSINGYKSDGFNIGPNEVLIDQLADKLKGGKSIPAFGVTFGKQNQSLFKTLTLNTDNPGTTEASLAATFNIINRYADSPRESNLYGQDLYRVYSSYSYKAQVEMMGNAQIMPLMVFELNNIPLWKGAYIISKVSHNIVPGNMTTTFTGQRICRNTIPISEGTMIYWHDEIAEEDNEDSLTRSTSAGTWDGSEESSINETRTVLRTDGTIIETLGNSNYTLKDTIDFNASNVTTQKPIICITPAHGPKTQKSLEWTWSTKMIDEYLIPKLKQKKYKDGTPLNIQRCNKGGNHTGTGYSMQETANLIKKYGSKCVISVVPHWNGCGGNYHGAYLNKVSNGSREDSQLFAKCLAEAAMVIASKRETYESNGMPIGAMDGLKNSGIKHLGESNTDGAPQQVCACVLTENWFADYPKGCKWWDNTEYNKMVDGDDGKKHYASMRGWLMSDEGCNAIADLHVMGIMNYINSL